MRRLSSELATLIAWLRTDLPRPEQHPRTDIAAWAADVARGPLTRFGSDGREHTCEPVCDPASPRHRPCFDQVPYTAMTDRLPVRTPGATGHRPGCGA